MAGSGGLLSKLWFMFLSVHISVSYCLYLYFYDQSSPITLCYNKSVQVKAGVIIDLL